MLYASLRRDKAAAKQEVRRASLAEVGPWSQAWHLVTDLLEEVLPIYGVERIGKVEFEEHLVWTIAVAKTPLTCNLKTYFRSQRLSYTYL